MAEFQARQPERVVQQVEREQRHQPHEGDKAPALMLDAVDELLHAPARLLRHPVRGEVAGDQKRQGGAQGGPGQVVKRAQHRAEQGAAGQGEDRARQEQHGGERIDQHEQQRRADARALYPGLKRRDVEPVAVDYRQRNARRETEGQQDAYQTPGVHAVYPLTPLRM